MRPARGSAARGSPSASRVQAALAQARRKNVTPAGVKIVRHLGYGLREIGFLLLAAVAVFLLLSLASFTTADSAWTHTASDGKIGNLGGVAGAWFADIALYFFGYVAFLIPLAIAYAGWTVFKRNALTELDAEIVVFRTVGFLVTIGAGCGLASLLLVPKAGFLHGNGGGIAGDIVGEGLVGAFSFYGGTLFLLALFLAGVTLASGLSWLGLIDLLGRACWELLAALGRLAGALGGRVLIGRDAPASAADQAEQAAEGSRRRAEPELGELATAAPVPEAEPDAALPRFSARETAPAVEPPRPTAVAAVAAEDEAATAFDANDAAPAAETASTRGRVEPAFESEPAPWEAGDETGPVRAPLEPPAQGTRIELPLAVLSGDADDDDDAEPLPAFAATRVLPEAELVLGGGAVRSRDADPAPPAKAAPAASRPPQPGLSERAHAALFEPKPRPVPLDPIPPLELLDLPRERAAGYTPEVLEEMSRQVESKLAEFNIDVAVVNVEPGPVVTRFELDLAPGVKVSQITSLAKDVARGLSVVSVRVVEVIPGKSVIGLEIPNKRRRIVHLREVLESSAYQTSSSPLTVTLGHDIGGRPIVGNLAKMPHALVAGTTGSGKSVAVNGMLISMLYKATPEQLRLILIDPKMLELSIYEGIPHLLSPVVTDMKDAANALRWCVAEMERRYRLMAALKVRNIAGFNKLVHEAIATGEPIPDPLWKPEDTFADEAPLLEPLPYVVVVIDELADMMMIVGKKVEELIARLAQKARAAGIHLILATQRPSVDVITGLIKANIPTRIALTVASKIDSRTILDQMGAEQLLGHGDMLYLPPGTGFPQRVHGAFVDDHEVNAVVEYLKQTGEPAYMDGILDEPIDGGPVFPGDPLAAGEGSGEGDPLYDQAVRVVLESRRASVSGIQRRLKIGYNRAARLVEEMEIAGLVGPLQPNGSREVLVGTPAEG